MKSLSLLELPSLIRTREELVAHGWAESDIDRKSKDSPFHRLHRNRYIAADVWSELWPESRHRAEVWAAVSEMRGGSGIVSHISAAVGWELPLFRHVPKEVEFTVFGKLRATTRCGIRRHLDRLESSDVVIHSGILCTSLERTVFDVARLQSAEVAIACLDAALRSISVNGHEWDAEAHHAWKVRMTARAAASAGARGIKQARWLIGLADGRAHLPGESVSRLQLARLGFATPQLQVPIPAPRGRRYFVDFGMADVEAFGEFDGKDKYLDEAMRRGIPLEQVLLEEKRREDWIRGTTQWRFARWGDEHIGTPDALRRRLAVFGIHPHH